MSVYYRRIIVVLLVTAGAASAQTTEPRPNIYGCGITWGSWLGLTGERAREWDRRSMDKIVEMGGTNCPANFAWIDIERTPGVFYWDEVDHQVNEALARGLEIFAYTGLTPDWALPPGILAKYGSGIGYRFPPDEQYIAHFENFFRTLAARYRGRVKYYEFWNEPNGCSWINDGCANGHMAHTYVPWLIRWYNAMKEGDPDCVLAIGGLDYGDYVSNGDQYLRDIYTHGGGDYFDAVAIHPYGNPLNWQAITNTYQVLLDHGHGHKKLWLNEYGWNTTNEAQRAANITAVLTELKKPEYHMVFQANHLVITDLPGTPDWGRDYGLCSRVVSTLTITPRQAWYAFRDLDKRWPLAVDFSADVLSGPLPLSVQFTDLTWYSGRDRLVLGVRRRPHQHGAQSAAHVSPERHLHRPADRDRPPGTAESRKDRPDSRRRRAARARRGQPQLRGQRRLADRLGDRPRQRRTARQSALGQRQSVPGGHHRRHAFRR